LTDVKTMMQLC